MSRVGESVILCDRKAICIKDYGDVLMCKIENKYIPVKAELFYSRVCTYEDSQRLEYMLKSPIQTFIVYCDCGIEYVYVEREQDGLLCLKTKNDKFIGYCKVDDWLSSNTIKELQLTSKSGHTLPLFDELRGGNLYVGKKYMCYQINRRWFRVRLSDTYELVADYMLYGDALAVSSVIARKVVETGNLYHAVVECNDIKYYEGVSSKITKVVTHCAGIGYNDGGMKKVGLGKTICVIKGRGGVGNVGLSDVAGEYGVAVCLGMDVGVVRLAEVEETNEPDKIKICRRHTISTVTKEDFTETIEDVKELLLEGLVVRNKGAYTIVPKKYKEDGICRYIILKHGKKIAKGKCSAEAYRNYYPESTLK